MKQPGTVFQRYETKYVLTAAQERQLMDMLAPHIAPDSYGVYTICNIYYDTDTYELVRTSIEKPPYKEKLRLRSYGVPGDADTVFLELKKKYRGIVYKRRAAMRLCEAEAFAAGGAPPQDDPILRELAFFLQRYRPHAAMFIAYDRTAYDGIQDEGLRLTFDRSIRSRREALNLRRGDAGGLLLPDGEVVMEIKTPLAIPVWLVHILSAAGIYPTSFSKYGRIYQQLLINQRGKSTCSQAF